MSMMKKSTTSKFISADLNDFINESSYLKNSPKGKKISKRQRPDKADENNSRPNINTIGAKKKKSDENVEVCKESREKLINVMRQQIETRKKTNENLMKSLSEVITHFEADYNVMKDNEQKLEHLTGAFMKCIQQATIGHKQKLKGLKEIQTMFKKECEEMEADHKEQTDKLGQELEEDIKELQQKLISETKRNGWETLRALSFKVEGLLTRGAMKIDDRPLWFDVYKAFPPNAEPKFARPKPEAKPIRQILYKEDVIRVKFHSKGHGLGTNMLNPSGMTQTKRLIQQYEKLKSEGVPENELIDKSVDAVSTERQVATQITPKNRDSVTGQVLNEANIANIFKE